ncbi:beta-glucosidase BglX [Paenibacillus sp. 19GGS1-52]|uniref:beta-glucosidase BglX n=1 Tax=Paenibacillus sp. 19GGS1-52 TaxID=2758563 RepID=UPI001EFB1F7D|nr:beta-glucosidase BglX [Paenibacillus sp. 19GGS1-52]ULO09043.1 beta-glucosidase BglX [Paenibacillus sp. 19GGS1-52]
MTKLFIQDLLNEMTLEEKLAQLTQLGPYYWGLDDTVDLTGPFKELNIKPHIMENIGSVLNGTGARNVIELQTRHLQTSRQKIPLLFMADVIHGFRTILPIPLAMGCTFDLEACERFAEIAAKESAAAGIHVTFSPMTDLVRDPRWGRVMETSGEDPYLNARVTESMVRGYQGKDLKEKGRIAACVKHFAGYGAPEGGREYNTVDVSSGVLREFYLPAYKAAVDAGVAMVMTAFNTVDRIPATGNEQLLRGILREEWGFNGVTIADFNSVNELIPHGAASGGSEAAEKSLTAGVDIEMMSTHYLNHGSDLVEQGKLDVALIDEAVIRVLELKDALGLFENPFKDADPQLDEATEPCAEHLQAARELGASSVVLLKNDNDTLPLKRGMKIGLAGPFATSVHVLGGWAGAEKEKDSAVSLYNGISQKTSVEDILTAMTGELGSMLEGVYDVEDQVEEAFHHLKDCDVILAAVGENQEDTGEGGSKTNLRLSANQEKLIWRLKDTGKKIVTIVFSGRPLELKPILAASDALLQAWFLGSESGNSLADVLFGDYNPSGRLSMSFPYTVGQIPVYYNAYQTGRPYDPQYPQVRYVTRYLDCPNDPLFCFGYGLSYSHFAYSDFAVEATDIIHASITIENTSEHAGKETIQLYIRDVSASVVRPVKELKGFRQLSLAAHEKQVVSFEITKDMLMFYGKDDKLIFEPGEFDIMLGRNSDDLFTERIWIG